MQGKQGMFPYRQGGHTNGTEHNMPMLEAARHGDMRTKWDSCVESVSPSQSHTGEIL